MFQNREEAGALLANKLEKYKDNPNVIILAVPRGGAVVGRRIADILGLPLSLAVVRKIGAPYNPELAVGAIAPGGIEVIDGELAARVGADREYLDKEIEIKRKELEERLKKYQISNIKYQIRNKEIVILVDDGIATGATTLAAVRYIKGSQKSKVPSARAQGEGKSQKLRIILAVPVVARDTFDRLKSEVEEIMALEIPEFFGAVGQFYLEFSQIDDKEVSKLLASSN